MKTFQYVRDDGSVFDDLTTLTVGELKKLLSEYPDEMPVLATWEGIYTPFRADDEYTGTEVPENWAWTRPEDKVECLVFDVDQY